MNSKGKIIIGTVCVFAGATLAFLLSPIKNKVSFGSFSCNKINNFKDDDNLEENYIEDTLKDKDIKE